MEFKMLAKRRYFPLMKRVIKKPRKPRTLENNYFKSTFFNPPFWQSIRVVECLILGAKTFHKFFFEFLLIFLRRNLENLSKGKDKQLLYMRFFISNQVAKVKNGLKVKQLAKQSSTLKTLLQKGFAEI